MRDLLLNDWGSIPAVHPPYAEAEMQVKEPLVKYEIFIKIISTFFLYQATIFFSLYCVSSLIS